MVAGEAWSREKESGAAPKVERSMRRSVDTTKRRRAYQQVVSVSVGAVGEATRLFVIEISPTVGIDAVRIAAIGVVWRKVRGPTTDVWSKELSGTVLELSAELSNVLSETSVLFLELPNTVHGTHVIIGEAHRRLEPSDGLLELRREKVRTEAKGERSEEEWYLLDVGLSLGAVAGLGLCVPAALTIILGGERGARGGGGSGDGEGYVVRRRRHHVRQ